MINKNKEIKEDFCPACLVVPLAFVGAGAAAAGEVVPKKHKKWKKTLLISGILTFVFAIGLLVYYNLSLKKDCNGSCKL
jgi:tellurite resistance protein TehA-like permease